MAIYMLSAKIIGRSTGGNAVAAAAYRSGEKLHDGEKTHDYTRKQAVVESFILAPSGAQEWATDRAELWSTVEQTERRKDSQLAREIIISLPRELSLKAGAEVVKDFVTRELVSRGMVADVSIHNPMAGDGKSNPHAHIMLTMRGLEGEGFGKKCREWNAAFGNTKGKGKQGGVTASEGLQALRERWADSVNNALDEADSDARISHLSNEAQGLDRVPQPKVGKAWHSQSPLAAVAHARRDDVRSENLQRRYSAAPATAKRRSQATTIAQNYAVDAELLEGLYGGQEINREWQASHEPMIEREQDFGAEI